MRQRTLAAAFGVITVACASVSAQAATTTTANPYLTEQASATPGADQGSNANFRSYITGVTPAAHGLQVQILAFADRLQIYNHTGRTVTIFGYQGEPYARLLADGTVQLNERSPALYLNTSFYGGGSVPSSANPSAPPQWATVYKTGAFQWHDHRIHWASPQTPPQVTDKSKRTLIFNWTVPISVGSTPGAIRGQLFWAPDASTASIGAYIVLAVIAVLGLLLVVVVRRRRARPPGSPAGPGGETTPTVADATREAW